MRLQNYFKDNIYANRGMTLESDINQTNEYYNLHNIALIYKKPTPIRVVQVEYPKNRIREAYFNEPSTLDYTGVYQGKYLEFDAKETQRKTSFPLSNIHKHQMEHIKKVLYYGGIVYLVVRFSALNRTYLLLGNDLLRFLEEYDRKSIPLDYFEKFGYFIEMKYAPRLDYIKVIDKIINTKEWKNHEKENEEKGYC